MEVHFTPEKESRLHQVATRIGKNPEQVVVEAVDRMLEYDERFIAAVEDGRASARRGDLLEHEEVVERIEHMLRSGSMDYKRSGRPCPHRSADT